MKNSMLEEVKHLTSELNALYKSVSYKLDEKMFPGDVLPFDFKVQHKEFLKAIYQNVSTLENFAINLEKLNKDGMNLISEGVEQTGKHGTLKDFQPVTTLRLKIQYIVSDCWEEVEKRWIKGLP